PTARCTWPELISTNDADAVCASRISPRTSVRKSCSVGMVPPMLSVKHMGTERPADTCVNGLFQFKLRNPLCPPDASGEQGTDSYHRRRSAPAARDQL